MDITEQLMRDERFVPHAYPDSLGYLTIGYGRLIDKRRGGGLTKDESAYLLRNDIKRTEEALRKALPWVATLNDARYGVLVGMGYNLGVAGLLKFSKFLAAMESEDFTTAAVEMMDSLWAKQVRNRATRLRDQILTGEWR